MKAKRTAQDVMAALSRRYQPPAWALLEQVGSGTGWNRNRYADALALGLWPSRGLDLHGFEVKVHRNDWLRELKNPMKAEDIAGVCDFWWIAAVPGVVDRERDHVPEPWGILELNGRGLVQVKPATKLAAAPLDRPQLAAIFRRATERMVPRSGVQSLIDAAREEGEAVGRNLGARDNSAEHLLNKVEGLEHTIAEFRKASGVDMEWFNTQEVGAAVKLALALGREQLEWQVDAVQRAAERIVADMKKVRAETQPRT